MMHTNVTLQIIRAWITMLALRAEGADVAW
jgi:hypothetical protein